MDYYNYTSKFNEIIGHQETIITNQEAINTNLEQILLYSQIISFAVIFNIVLGIIKKCFAVR